MGAEEKIRTERFFWSIWAVFLTGRYPDILPDEPSAKMMLRIECSFCDLFFPARAGSDLFFDSGQTNFSIILPEAYGKAMPTSSEKIETKEEIKKKEIKIDLQNKQFVKHIQFPHNLGLLQTFDGKATGVGSCGDAIEISLKIDDGVIAAIGQLPHGCSYTIACASAVSMLATGKTVDDALLITPKDVDSELNGLPEDHYHCARLAVNTLGEAIESACRKIIHLTSKEEL